jgi:hypothetical protein
MAWLSRLNESSSSRLRSNAETLQPNPAMFEEDGPFRVFVIAAKLVLLAALPFFAFGFGIQVLELQKGFSVSSFRLWMFLFGAALFLPVCSARDSRGDPGSLSAPSSTSLLMQLLESLSSFFPTASMQPPLRAAM